MDHHVATLTHAHETSLAETSLFVITHLRRGSMFQGTFFVEGKHWRAGSIVFMQASRLKYERTQMYVLFLPIMLPVPLLNVGLFYPDHSACTVSKYESCSFSPRTVGHALQGAAEVLPVPSRPDEGTDAVEHVPFHLPT